MGLRGNRVCVSNATCLYLHRVSGPVQRNLSRTFSSQQEEKEVKERTVSVMKRWGRTSVRTAKLTFNDWWQRYEEFVGLIEVRDAQSKVTEAEKSFMVARGMVREAQASLEALQVRLKEVRDRLDRVSREEAHYLELATVEHKLLQDERRLRTAHENAEEAEREKFALFSAAVRESHDKERTRAERTKNWSVVGSVLGAVIGVMGSTYVNRVRLQELKNLLLEAQKGPVSLQEALKVQASVHKAQQEELSHLIHSLRAGGVTPEVTSSVTPPVTPPDPTLKQILESSVRAQGLMEGLKESVGKVEAELRVARGGPSPRPAQLQVCHTEAVVQGLGRTEQRLQAQIQRSGLYNAALTCAAFAVTVPLLYFVLGGT